MIDYRGEKFSGYNKPKNARTKTKKFAVLAKSGNKVKLIRYGDANMTIKKSNFLDGLIMNLKKLIIFLTLI